MLVISSVDLPPKSRATYRACMASEVRGSLSHSWIRKITQQICNPSSVKHFLTLISHKTGGALLLEVTQETIEARTP